MKFTTLHWGITYSDVLSVSISFKIIQNVFKVKVHPTLATRNLPTSLIISKKVKALASLLS